MQYLNILIYCSLIIPVITQLIDYTNQGKNKNRSVPVNILVSLPYNDTLYKFSLAKVLVALNLAISDFEKNNSIFQVEIIAGDCDCSATRATFNAMENIYRFRYQNSTQLIQAIFGPMCD